METIKLKAHIGSDGILKLEMPTHFKDVDTEVVVVLHPTSPQSHHEIDWAIDYFKAIDAIEADDMIERPDQGQFEMREPIE